MAERTQASLYETPAVVIAEEIRSLKPTAKVYEQRAALFFLSSLP